MQIDDTEKERGFWDYVDLVIHSCKMMLGCGMLGLLALAIISAAVDAARHEVRQHGALPVLFTIAALAAAVILVYWQLEFFFQLAVRVAMKIFIALFYANALVFICCAYLFLAALLAAMADFFAAPLGFKPGAGPSDLLLIVSIVSGAVFFFGLYCWRDSKKQSNENHGSPIDSVSFTSVFRAEKERVPQPEGTAPIRPVRGRGWLS